MSPISLAVIGRHGQLATALARAAKVRGVPCTLVGRPEADLRDPAAIDNALRETRANLIINAAAYTRVDDAELERDLAFAVNAEGPEALAAIADRMNAPLIHISTDYVFDGEARQPYREADPIRPLGIYGASKAAGEEAIRRRLPRHVILRTSWVYGATGTNFVKTMLQLGAARDEVGVVADQFGRPTYAADLATTILDLAPRLVGRDDHDLWGTYHLAGAGGTTWYAFAEAIFAKAKAAGMKVPSLRPIATTDYPTRAKRPAYSVLDTTRFEQVFGLELRPWRQGLEA